MKHAMSPLNINTRDFWEDFLRNKWDGNDGRQQTRMFAHYFLETVRLPEGARTLLDVSCAKGDALPVIHERYPHLQLFGQDVSASAVEEARRSYGEIAEFAVAGFEDLNRRYDVIYCSNTLEHFEQFLPIAEHLLGYCDWLYVQVPYKEMRRGKPLTVEPGEYHVATFYKDSFDPLLRSGRAAGIRRWVGYTPGAWGPGPAPLWRTVAREAKALLLWRPRPLPMRQIYYEIRSAGPGRAKVEQ